VPFAAATIPLVTGGSGEYGYELSVDDELVGNDPIVIIEFDEVKTYEVKLKVTDLRTGNSQTATVAVNGLEPLPGLPLEATLYTADFFGVVPFTASVLGIVAGGTPPYNYEIIVDGVSLYEDDNAPIHITAAGNHEVVFRATDAVGAVSVSAVNILGLEPEEEPLMRINFIAVPAEVPLGHHVGLITEVLGGQPPFQFQIKVDDNVVSTEPTFLYRMNTLGELMAEVSVTDATGMTSEAVAWMTGYEPYVYTPSTTVDITATPPEQQIGEPIFLHADVRGEYDLIEWLYTNYNQPMPTLIGTGEDVSYEFDLGYHDVEARVFKQGELVATDTVQVLTLPPDQPELPTVDATATPWIGVVPFYTTFHADVRGGTPPYDIVWYDASGNSIGCCDLYRQIDVIGEQLFTVRATDSLGLVATDTIKVAGNSGEAIYLDVTGGPQGLPAPVDVTLQAHASGGDGSYHYRWYYPTAATLFSTERFPVYPDLGSGMHTFICVVNDDSGHEDIDSVTITVLEPQGSDTVWWSFCPAIQVGPRDHFATTTATIDTAGQYQTFIQFEWDTQLDDRGDCIAEIVLPNGHRWVWELYDIYTQRPKVVYYELGEIYLTGQMTFNLYWRSNDKADGEKCDGWDKWQLISGSASIPADKSADVEVIRLDDPQRDAYIRRQ